MSFVFKPAIFRDSILYELPRPVSLVKMTDIWDFERFKVPLSSGDSLLGQSLHGVEIILEGNLGSQGGTLKLTEQQMFDEIDTLRTKLDVTAATSLFEFFLYHDTSSATYRKFKKCSGLKFEWDLSNEALFSFAAVIHASDTKIYTTAPGI